MFYIDVAQGEFEPVTYQSSNTTIKAYWNFVDDDSEIAVSKSISYLGGDMRPAVLSTSSQQMFLI